MSDQTARILWIEDDLALASLYLAVMEKQGFIVRHFENGASALQAFKEFGPNLLLLDLMLPGLSGFDILQTVRQMSDIAQPKVLILSAMSQPEDMERARQLGANDYLVKSELSLNQIMDTIRHTLDLPAGSTG